MEFSQCPQDFLHLSESKAWNRHVLTRQVLFSMPLIVVFSLIMGIDGVMYAGPIADAAAFVLAILFARRELVAMKK